MLFCLPEDKCD